MDSTEFIETVSEENKTALSRLGSSKALYAMTEGEMDDETVLAGGADRAHYVAETVDGWDGSVFADAANTARDHYATITGELDDHEPGDRPALFEALANQRDTAARLGGLAGWALVADKTYEQLTGYFVGQADPQTSQLFRDMRGDIEDRRIDALDALAEDGDWETAETAASEVVQAAYDGYFETLEALGVNPKPVC